MNNLLQDLRFGIRMLVKRPGPTLVIVLTLGLAIGANTTIFTWIKGVVLQPLPGVEEADRLLTINGVRGGRGGLSNSYPDYEYFRDRNTVFSGLVAYELLFVNLGFEGRPDIVTGGIVSGNYFDMLGFKAAIGRTFLPEEDATENTHPVAVLSHDLWQRRFAADASVVGKIITLNGRSFTVIGVAPQGFAGTYGGLGQELWVPLHMQSQLLPEGGRLTGARWLQIMGRLRSGVTREQAQAELSVLAGQLAQERPDTNRGLEMRTYTLDESQRGFQSALAPVLQILMAVVGLILLIACANVSSLLLARAMGRRKEIAIRMALGGSRARLARQLLTESLMLALLGGAVGFLMAIWMADLLQAVIPPTGPISLGLNVSLDGSVLAFTLAVSLATGVIFGLAPAIQSSNPNLATTLTQESGALAGGRGKSRLRSLLVIAQIALSCIALIGAGLFIRTLQMSLTADPGFNLNNVAVISSDLFLNGYDDARGRQFYDQLVEHVGSLPGVESASFASYIPLALGEAEIRGALRSKATRCPQTSRL